VGAIDEHESGDQRNSGGKLNTWWQMAEASNDSFAFAEITGPMTIDRSATFGSIRPSWKANQLIAWAT
jgi:hypothetical protein